MTPSQLTSAVQSEPRNRRLGLLILVTSAIAFYGGFAVYIWQCL